MTRQSQILISVQMIGVHLSMPLRNLMATHHSAVLYRRQSILMTFAALYLFIPIPLRIHTTTRNHFALSYWVQLVPGIQTVFYCLSPNHFLFMKGPARERHMSLFHAGNVQNHYSAHYRSHQGITLPLRNQLGATTCLVLFLALLNLKLSIARKKLARVCSSRTKGL